MDNYTFTNRSKRIIYILMGLGLIGVIIGLLMGGGNHGEGHGHGLGQRFWANLLVNSFFFLGIAAAATFFMALQYATESHYAVTVKRVYEAISSYLPIGGAFLIIVLLAGTFHIHHLYHWMAEGITDTGSENYDEIIAGKSGFLNQPFFWARTLAYLGIWIWFQRVFRKRSLQEDMEGGENLHWKNVKSAAIFLVLYGVTSSTSAWDWLMSIDTHWFSTMFGWYVFSGTWCSSMVMLVLFILYLKSKGYLQQVNEYHLHDISKWVFATSFLWSYLWFCQFMLIWYSNIPEEVTYFMARWENYKFMMWAMFAVNFALPMVFLMSRDAKRNPRFIAIIGSIIFFTHWVDVFQIVMPGTVGSEWHFLNPLELGMFLMFLGIFLFVVHTQLTKAPLMVKSHPYLEESLHHEF